MIESYGRRPGWNRPNWNRPNWNRPNWNRPGWNRPGNQSGFLAPFLLGTITGSILTPNYYPYPYPYPYYPYYY